MLRFLCAFLHKIFQMAIKYISIFQSKTLQNLPKLGFWFENKPSGNPGADQTRTNMYINNAVLIQTYSIIAITFPRKDSNSRSSLPSIPLKPNCSSNGIRTHGLRAQKQMRRPVAKASVARIVHLL
jgi:hypothetical protein